MDQWPLPTSGLGKVQGSPDLQDGEIWWNMVKSGRLEHHHCQLSVTIQTSKSSESLTVSDQCPQLGRGLKSKQKQWSHGSYFYVFSMHFSYVWETSKLCWGKHHGALGAWFTKQWTLACTAGSRCLQHSPTRAAAIVRTCQDLNHSSQSDGVGLGPYTTLLQVSPGTWLTMVNNG